MTTPVTIFSHGELARLYRQLTMHGFVLLTLLRDQYGDDVTFQIGEALNEMLRMRRQRFYAARRELIALGHVVLVRRGNGRLGPSLYRWPAAVRADQVPERNA